MNGSTAVTTQQPFDQMDSAPLFSVNPGVPVDEALERAAHLMLYVEKLAAADASTDKAFESAIVQTLSEMTKALVRAAKQGEGEGKPEGRLVGRERKGAFGSPFLSALVGAGGGVVEENRDRSSNGLAARGLKFRATEFWIRRPRVAVCQR